MTKRDNSSANSGLRRLWKRRSVKLLTGFLAFAVFIVVTLPVGARLYLQKWLVENGAETATIEKVRFNPFTGTAALYGVDIGKDGQTVFSNSTIYLDAGLKNLLGHEATLQRATITDVVVDIEQYEDGTLRIASYNIPPGQEDSIDTPSEIAEELETNVPWIFAVNQINIKNVMVRYKQPDLRVELVVEEAFLDRFNTDPNDIEGVLTLKGTLNGAPVILDLSALNIVPQVEVKGTVDIADVHLDDLAEFLGEYLQPFSGTAGVQGEVAFSMTDAENLNVHYDGLINLGKGDIGGDGWATKGDIDWKGKVSFAMEKEEMVVDVDGDLRALNAAFDMPDPVIDIDNSDINIAGKTTVTIAEEVVVDTGASLKLAPTTFSMDILKTATGDTSWDGKVRVETGTDTKGLSVQTEGKLQVAKPAYNMDVNGALMEVANQMLSFDGRVEYTMGVGTVSTDHVRTDGILLADATTFSLPEIIQVSQSEFNLGGKTEISIGQDIGVTYTGDVSLGETGVEMTGFDLGEKQFTWSGQVEYLLAEQSQKITLDGELKTEDVFVGIAESGLRIDQQNLQGKPNFSLLLEESPSFTGEVSVEAKGLRVGRKETELLTLAEMSMARAKDNGAGGAMIGSLVFDQLDMPASQDIPVSVTIPSITVTDILSPDLSSASVALLTVEKPKIVDGEKKTQLALMDAITAETIQVNKDISTTVEKIIVDKGSFLEEKDKNPMITLGQLKVDQISYSLEQGLSCNTVDLDSFFADIKRQKTTESTEKQDKSVASDTEKSEEPIGLPVKINQVSVTGKSGFKFTDETLTKQFLTIFTIKSLQVRDIDLTDPNHPFTYSLKGMFDKYSPLSIDGTSAPLADNLFVEQKTTLQNYSMLHASPYTVEAIGTYFLNGRLDLTSSLKIAEGKIDMENDLVFKELDAETVHGELADKLNNQLPVPLDLALVMLRDSDGTIELDIPLKGNLDDMNVGVTDIIVTALGKGISVAVVPYLAYTFLGPTGALAFAGVKVGASLLNTDLPSLEFDPGGTEITESHLKILDKVGEIIEKDKEKSYSICAKVGLNELSKVNSSKDKKEQDALSEAVRKELFELGETRSLAVKKYMLLHFKIDEERLLICNPGINFKESDRPKIEFKK